jgi:hypothetical protein
MSVLIDLNYLILFFVELAMLYNFAVWGFTLKGSIILRYLAGLGVPSAVIVLWGMFFSPDPAIILVQPWNAMGEYVLFILAALAVACTGRIKWAAWFLLVAIVSETIALIWG